MTASSPGVGVSGRRRAVLRPGRRATGLMLVFGSATAFGTMPVFAKVAYRSGAEPVSLLAIRFSVATVLLVAVVVAGAAVSYAVIAAVARPDWPRDPGGWLAAVAVGLVGTVFAMLAFFAGLTRLGPTDASVASTVEPVVTALLGVVVLGESLSPLQVTGAMLVLAAVVALTRSTAAAPKRSRSSRCAPRSRHRSRTGAGTASRSTRSG